SLRHGRMISPPRRGPQAPATQAARACTIARPCRRCSAHKKPRARRGSLQLQGQGSTAAVDEHLRGMKSLAPLFGFVGDALSLGQRPVPLGLDRRVVHEHVFAATLGFYKAIAFCVVEPLDCTATTHHTPPLQYQGLRKRQEARADTCDQYKLENNRDSRGVPTPHPGLE